MTTIIDGRKISENIISDIGAEVTRLPFVPIFCDVLVGSNPVSAQYVKMKKKIAEKVGMAFHEATFPDDISTENLIEEIKKINTVPRMCGIIIQLPLPAHLDQQAVLDAVDPRLDVDCLGAIASEKFYAGDFTLGFPTALSCMALLDSVDQDLSHKKFLIIGQGKLVGKPISMIIKSKNFNFKTLDSDTENKEQVIKEADVIISAIGNGKYLKGEMVKDGAIIIDAGTSESGAGIVGDVDLESMLGKASFVSPVPGGVGPMTVAMLFSNVLKVVKGFKL